ncbi:hypothetical protein L9F63_004725, partial [Diploptera punctata]
MARPLVTTAMCCVFCFLCAAHVQCVKHHTSVLSGTDAATVADVDTLEAWEELLKKQRRKRNKREVSEDQVFVKRLFHAFGEGDTMTLEGFERLLKTVGLERLVSPAASIHVMDNVSPPTMSNVANNKLEVNASRIQPNAIVASSDEVMNSRETNNHSEKCLNGRELFSAFSQDRGKLQPESLQQLCPGLLFQLTNGSTDCIMVPVHHQHDHHDIHVEIVNHSQVWLYATLSILLVSLCGLLGVAVIPVMQRVFYQQLLQFLVALAVGTLCGDALLHLLPHAMVHESHSHSHSQNDHDVKMWRGLVAALGLVFFFFTEKCLTMLGEWRKAHQRKRKGPSRVRVMRDQDNVGNTSVGEKLCKHKYSSYPYCYGEITTEMTDDHHRAAQYDQKQQEHIPVLDSTQLTGTGSLDETQTDEMRPMAGGGNSVTTAPDSEHGTELNPSEAESYTVIIREHENKHHGHSHTHGHVHSPPDTLSSVAWMVVMGDGLHNFTDGMAIGAAFAANIPGGFSTAVAVFCHELPHELGDFAVLLKAGMSAKQAVFYNLIVFNTVSPAAGMFLYIALVDMIPELTTSHSKEGGSLCQCLLQCVGLLSGIGIMTLIAMYEHDLKTVCLLILIFINYEMIIDDELDCEISTHRCRKAWENEK